MQRDARAPTTSTTASARAGHRRREPVRPGAERRHDQHDLDALQQHALAGHDPRRPVRLPGAGGAPSPRAPRAPRGTPGTSSTASGAPGEPQHALAQPLEPEQQQRGADHDLQRLERQPREQQRPDRHDDDRQQARTAPTAPITASRQRRVDADREHDRQRLEQLEPDGQRRRRSGVNDTERASPGALLMYPATASTVGCDGRKLILRADRCSPASAELFEVVAAPR